MIPVSSFPLEILFEDGHVIAVVKPAGMLSQGDSSEDRSVLDEVRDYIRKSKSKKGNVYLGLVHRLDRPVHGVMVFAKTSKAASRLSAQFRKNSVEKTYNAVVEGVPEKNNDVLEDYVLKLKQKKQVRVVHRNHPDSRKAVLEYAVSEVRDGFTLVTVKLLTGRSHQVRVQFSSRGWPVLGDTKYGSLHQLDERVIALRAAGISFMHPTKDEQIVLEAPAPSWWPWPPAGKYRRSRRMR